MTSRWGSDFDSLQLVRFTIPAPDHFQMVVDQLTAGQP